MTDEMTMKAEAWDRGYDAAASAMEGALLRMIALREKPEKAFVRPPNPYRADAGRLA